MQEHDDVRAVALRTLSRDVNDSRPVPDDYLSALRDYLNAHPDEDNFLMQLDEQGGMATCMDCWDDVACGQLVDGEFEFKDLRPLEEHNALPAHIQRAATRKTQVSTIPTTPHRGGARTSVSGSSPARTAHSTPSSHHSKQQFTFPDGEVVELSEDEEDIKPIERIDIKPVVVRPRQSNESSASSASIRAPAPRPRRRVVKRVEFGDGEVLEYSSEEEVPLPGDDSSTSGMKRKRYDFGDEVIELSDDDSDDIGSTSYGASHWSQGSKRVKVELGPGEFLGASTSSDLLSKMDGVLSGQSSSGYNNYSIPGQWPEDAVGSSSAGGFVTSSQSAMYGRTASASSSSAANLSGVIHDRGGFGVNYNEGAPLHRIDVGGPNHEKSIEEFVESVAKDKDDRLQSVDDAARYLGIDSREDHIPGLQIVLKPYQLIGVAWMIEQERSGIRGGILADDMGLGKTVQAITLMTVRSGDKKKDSKYHGTLIVAPAALLKQWKDEIAEKTQDDMFTVHIHHGSDKLKSLKELKRYDVVITTYHTLCNDYSREDDDPIGPLAQNVWHRVILDEAQQIRNRATRISICAALLRSKYRWCLSGTPVTNSLADIYGFTRFIQYDPWNDWKYFNDQIARPQKKNPVLAGQRAHLVLARTLLRRKKTSMLEGKPILQLPEKLSEVVEIEFSEDERQVYDAIETKAKHKVNKFIKAGTLLKNYAFLLVMLLRLRQVCNHPRLIVLARSDTDFLDGIVVGEDDEEDGPAARDPLAGNEPDKVLKRAIRDVGQTFADDLRKKCRERAVELIDAEANGEEPEIDGDCPICFDAFNVSTAVYTACGHKFCHECITDVLKSPLRQEDAANNLNDQVALGDSRPCPVCRTPIHKTRLYRAVAFEPSEDELEALRQTTEKGDDIASSDEDDDDLMDLSFTSKGKGKGKGKAKAEPDELNLDDLALGDKSDWWEPSSKMLKMMEYLKEWESEYPDEKIIMYSQWTSMIDMMVELLQRETMDCLVYDGRMTRNQRDDTIQAFKKADGCRILILSLKCGGVGLNLVNANRVICLDLAWNNATEEQAVDRCYRFPQTKDVVVKRIVVKNTIEDRILKLQQAKQDLADAALGEGTAMGQGRLSIKDIKLLFNIQKNPGDDN